MTSKLFILRYIDCDVAQFDTHSVDGTRVKHYIYPTDDGIGYWHEEHYLAHNDIEPVHKATIDISDRRFWGKVRLVCLRDAHLPETWDAIASAVRYLEELKKHKEEEK